MNNWEETARLPKGWLTFFFEYKDKPADTSTTTLAGRTFHYHLSMEMHSIEFFFQKGDAEFYEEHELEFIRELNILISSEEVSASITNSPTTGDVP